MSSMERRSTLPELLLPPVCVCVSCVFVCVSFLDLAPFLEQPADILLLHPPQVVALDQMARPSGIRRRKTSLYHSLECINQAQVSSMHRHGFRDSHTVTFTRGGDSKISVVVALERLEIGVQRYSKPAR